MADFFSMRRRICAWDLDPRRTDSIKPNLERHLRFLPHLDWHKVKTLDDPSLLPCDLLIVYAWHLDHKELIAWLQGFEQRIKKHGLVWIPALIITPLDYTQLADVMEQTILSNWYFDLVHPDHLNSIPMRVANLLRIHDHLHELNRYAAEIDKMQKQIANIEHKLKQQVS